MAVSHSKSMFNFLKKETFNFEKIIYSYTAVQSNILTQFFPMVKFCKTVSQPEYQH